MKKQPKKYFLQNWGTYSNDTFVCVGMNKKEITEALKKLSASKDIIDRWENKGCDFHEIGSNASVWEEDGLTLLWFKKWTKTWNDLNVLVHEIYHLIYLVLHKRKGMADEQEGCAYQFEYLFNEMRKKLDKLLK